MLGSDPGSTCACLLGLQLGATLLHFKFIDHEVRNWGVFCPHLLFCFLLLQCCRLSSEPYICEASALLLTIPPASYHAILTNNATPSKMKTSDHIKYGDYIILRRLALFTHIHMYIRIDEFSYNSPDSWFKMYFYCTLWRTTKERCGNAVPDSAPEVWLFPQLSAWAARQSCWILSDGCDPQEQCVPYLSKWQSLTFPPPKYKY